MRAQMSTSHLSCSLGRADLYLAQPLRGEDAFPTGCRGGREMIIIIINDVQDLVSTCLYKHQIVSSVPALKLPRVVSFLLFSQPCSSHPSPPAPHKGTASFGSPHCVLEALLAAKSCYELGKIKYLCIFSWFSSFLVSPAKPCPAPGSMKQTLHLIKGWIGL